MLKTNYPDDKRGDELTSLTKMLMTVAPKDKGDIKDGYEENYKAAYRRCQDKPGGKKSLFDLCIRCAQFVYVNQTHNYTMHLNPRSNLGR